MVHDSDVTSARGYASDITRTLQVGAKATPRQRELYDIVLRAQRKAIAMLHPGVAYRDVHCMAAASIVADLCTLGLFRGAPSDVVASGAYAVCMPCGLGHQIGLDVHDMESIGEDLVGYDSEIGRSALFGLNRLRLGKRLRAGMTLTVEPGVYFIPSLIDQWQAQRLHAALIDYRALRKYLDAGGIRIEDDVLTTEQGARMLGPAIPSDYDAVAALMG